MLRRSGPRRDGGAGLAEYAGLVVLAALILGALVALGLPSKVEAGVSSAICQIFQGENCGKPEASGQNPGQQNPGGQNPGDRQTGGPDNGGENGDEPSLGDLQKKADDAQKAANDANSKYGNIKQQIIDLLKDFIGITDIEECITKGSISSCLWAAFDVASWIFAALKIAKFAKAVKDAIKLWKVFNKGRKIISDAEKAAKREKEILNARRLKCGLDPVSYRYPNAPPVRIVPASFTYGGGSSRLIVVQAAATCPVLTSNIKRDKALVKAAGDVNPTAQQDIDKLTKELSRGNTNPGIGTKSLGKGISYLRGRNGGRVFFQKTKNGYEILAKSDKSNEDKVINVLRKEYGIK